MDKKYIAYEGSEYTIEWCWTENEKSPALEFFIELDKEHKKKALKLFELMGNFGKIHNKEKFNYEGDQIYAFKPLPHRFLCFSLKIKKLLLLMHLQKRQINCHRMKNRKL